LQGNGGIAGSVKGSAKVRLSEDAGGTLISYEVEAQVAGRMAQLGGPIIDATAKQLAGKFFSRFGDLVGGAEKPADPARSKAGASSDAALGSTTTLAAGAPALSGGLPMAWILATVVAALRLSHRSRPRWCRLGLGWTCDRTAHDRGGGSRFRIRTAGGGPGNPARQCLLRRLLDGAKE
jgi:hypothetical protein